MPKPFQNGLAAALDKETFCSTSTFVFVKNLLLLINFLSMIAGLILISGIIFMFPLNVGGGYMFSNDTEDIVGLSKGIASASIAIGAIIAIISFLGCFGAANEKKTILKVYFVFLLLLIIMQITVGSIAFAKREEIPGALEEAWKRTAAHPYNNQTILAMEKSFKCCGYSNVNEYAVPANCTIEQGFSEPCKTIVTNTIIGSLETIGAAGVSIGCIQFIGLLFSVYMFRKITKKESAQATLLNEAWRVNRTKVQYGYFIVNPHLNFRYQNYNYV